MSGTAKMDEGTEACCFGLESVWSLKAGSVGVVVLRRRVCEMISNILVVLFTKRRVSLGYKDVK